MEEHLHDIDKLFKSSIEGHSEVPSPTVWDEIDKKLDKSDVIVINRKYIRLKRVSAILLLLLLGLIGYEYNHNLTNKKHINEDGVKALDRAGSNKTLRETTNVTPPENKKSVESPSKGSENDPVLNKVHNNSPATTGKSTGGEYTNSSGTKKEKQLASPEFNQSNSEKEFHRNPKPFLHRQPASSRLSVLNAQTGIDNSDSNHIVKAGVDLAMITSSAIAPHATFNFTFDESRLPIRNSGQMSIHQNVKDGTKDIATVTHTSGKNRKAGKGKSVYLNPFFSPEFSFSNLKTDRPQGRGDDRHDIKRHEMHEFSSSAGVLIGYNLNPHLAVQTGIAIANSTIRGDQKNIYAEQVNSGMVKYRVNGSCGFVYVLPGSNTNPAIGDSVRAESKNSLQYLVFPLALKYELRLGKFTIVSLGGLSANFLTKGSFKTTIDNAGIKEVQTINTVEGLKKSYLGGLLSVGAEFSLSNRISITLSPTGRFALTSINNGAAVKSFPGSIGLLTGLKIKL